MCQQILRVEPAGGMGHQVDRCFLVLVVRLLDQRNRPRQEVTDIRGQAGIVTGHEDIRLSMPIRLTPKTTIGSVMPYDLAFGLSYDAAGNAADVPIGRRGGSVPAGCPVA